MLCDYAGQEGSATSLKAHDQQFHSSHSTVFDLAQVSLNYAKAIQDKSQSLGHVTRNMSTFHSQSKQGGSSLHSIPVEPTVGEKLAKQVCKSSNIFSI